MPSPATLFAQLCKAEALLWQSEERPLLDAVDWLQTYAVAKGLVDALGQDEVQRLMAEAFAAVQEPS
jgi:hypothetical protein